MPKDNTVRGEQITIRLSVAERKRLLDAATKDGRTMSDTARRAMLKGLK